MTTFAWHICLGPVFEGKYMENIALVVDDSIACSDPIGKPIYIHCSHWLWSSYWARSGWKGRAWVIIVSKKHKRDIYHSNFDKLLDNWAEQVWPISKKKHTNIKAARMINALKTCMPVHPGKHQFELLKDISAFNRIYSNLSNQDTVAWVS